MPDRKLCYSLVEGVGGGGLKILEQGTRNINVDSGLCIRSAVLRGATFLEAHNGTKMESKKKASDGSKVRNTMGY